MLRGIRKKALGIADALVSDKTTTERPLVRRI